MEVTLLVVTLLSIALAIAMGILTWRLLQEERLRSEARVAALEQGLAETLQDAYVTQSAASAASARLSSTNADTLASNAPASAAASTATSAPPAAATTPTSGSLAPNDLLARDETDWLAHFPASTMEAAAAARNGDRPFTPHPFAANDVSSASSSADRRPLAASEGPILIDIDDAPREARRPRTPETAFVTSDEDDAAAETAAAETVVNANGGLFGQFEADDDRSQWSRRALLVAPWAAVMIGAVIAFWTIGRLMAPPADRTGTVAARAGAGSSASAGGGAAQAAATALELMSLRQEMQDGTLKISGLVRNPRGGVPQERLTAVVFFFDGQGGFLSSTRAPLDYRALAPGQESPFQLSAPAPAGVARYRVSFRRDEGAIVPHIDRRQQVQQSLHGDPDQHSQLTPQPHQQLHQQQEASRS